jgi:hypothetical protein
MDDEYVLIWNVKGSGVKRYPGSTFDGTTLEIYLKVDPYPSGLYNLSTPSLHNSFDRSTPSSREFPSISSAQDLPPMPKSLLPKSGLPVDLLLAIEDSMEVNDGDGPMQCRKWSK